MQSSSQIIITNKPTSSFLQAGCPSCHPTNSVKHWREKYRIPWTNWTCLPQAYLGVFQLCLWPLVAPGYLGEGCHDSHQPSDASTPLVRNGYGHRFIWYGTKIQICLNLLLYCFVSLPGNFGNKKLLPSILENMYFPRFNSIRKCCALPTLSRGMCKYTWSSLSWITEDCKIAKMIYFLVLRIPVLQTKELQHTGRWNDAMEENSSTSIMFQLLTQKQPTDCNTQCQCTNYRLAKMCNYWYTTFTYYTSENNI